MTLFFFGGGGYGYFLEPCNRLGLLCSPSYLEIYKLQKLIAFIKKLIESPSKSCELRCIKTYENKLNRIICIAKC